MTFGNEKAGIPFGRRAVLMALGGAGALLATPALAQVSSMSFGQWVEHFRPRARAKGISDATYTRVMRTVTPDTAVFALDKNQAEFTETIWQYMFKRVSDWRVQAGRQRVAENMAILERVERAYGVDRYVLASIWGNESAYGEVLKNTKVMKPVFNSLCALAWGDPRRRPYWEAEVLNGLTIVEKGWGTPEQMTGSWAGAMGHTQWMPEVWLNMGVDFDGDGKPNPYSLADALAGTAQYFARRGKWRRGEPWGYEVRKSGSFDVSVADGKTQRSLAQWQSMGLSRADGKAFPDGAWMARARFPAGEKGPGFVLLHNFKAIMSYNPAFKYGLAVAHLADRLRGMGPFIQPWPTDQKPLTVEETSELQKRLTALGFDTGGTDGRAGDGTRKALQAWQKQVGFTPADGWPSDKALARLRLVR